MRGSSVVADASVIVKWVIDEKYSDEASRLRDDHLEGLVVVHAPDFVLLEVASALRKYVLKGVVGRDQAVKAFSLIADSDIRLVPINRELAREALTLSLELGVSVYDAAYLSLARRLNAPFYTSDERLLSVSGVRKLGVARHVTEYRARGG